MRRQTAPEREEECIRLIGELICTGIQRSPTLGRPVVPAAAPVFPQLRGPTDRVLDYLRRHHAASPSEIRGVLNLSRSTANRALQRLRDASLVLAHGRTTAAIYQLRDVDPSRN